MLVGLEGRAPRFGSDPGQRRLNDARGGCCIWGHASLFEDPSVPAVPVRGGSVLKEKTVYDTEYVPTSDGED